MRNLFILFVMPFISIILSINAYNNIREKNYYSDTNNYITEEAIVDKIYYNEDDDYIVLWLSEIDDSYQDDGFIIKGESVSVIIENGILDKIKVGDEITFTSAPAYFGNGHFMPIVEISVNGEELLSFEEGYENLLEPY